MPKLVSRSQANIPYLNTQQDEIQNPLLNIKQKLEFLNINQKQEPEPQYPAMKLNKGISNDLSKNSSFVKVCNNSLSIIH